MHIELPIDSVHYSPPINKMILRYPYPLTLDREVNYKESEINTFDDKPTYKTNKKYSMYNLDKDKMEKMPNNVSNLIEVRSMRMEK